MNTPMHLINTSPTKTLRMPARAGHLFRANLWCLALPSFLFCAVLLARPCDATPGEWDFTGSMNEQRSNYVATLLQNGKVLVEGGQGSGDQLVSAELYDPANATWSTTG